MTPLSALPIAAAALSLPLAWRTPAHRPLAVALVAAQALEAARPALPPELAWGALLALPALSAWAVRRVLNPDRCHREPEAPRVAQALGALWIASVIAPWSGWWPVALAAAVAQQGAAWWRWRADRVRRAERLETASHFWRNATGEDPPPHLARLPLPASQQAALVLAAGDAGGLFVGLAAGWAAVGWWAAAVAAVLLVVQARALLARKAGR